jgi:hypothetical protein
MSNAPAQASLSSPATQPGSLLSGTRALVLQPLVTATQKSFARSDLGKQAARVLQVKAAA